MALSILDGNQSATTLSTILSSGQHITAHTVVSLGTQAITDMRGAVSGSVVSISNFPATQTIAGTVTANIGSAGRYDNGGDSLRMDLMSVRGQDAAFFLREGGGNVPISGTVTANPTGTQTIAGTVTANIGNAEFDEDGNLLVCLQPGTNPSTQSISGTVTLGAGTAQIGSVTASISGTVPISISSVTVGNSVTIGSLSALVAGTAQIGSVTASISNSVTIGSIPAISGVVTAKMQGKYSGNYLDVAVNDQGYLAVVVDNQIGISELPALASGTNQIGSVTANTFAVQGTAVTTSNFTSTTASTVLANYNATREVLTIFNEGAGNLHICAGATCTTIAYQVRLSAGDYYEVPNHQTTITHSAVFATAGTARVTQVS